jgi:hypothetical protein
MFWYIVIFLINGTLSAEIYILFSYSGFSFSLLISIFYVFFLLDPYFLDFSLNYFIKVLLVLISPLNLVYDVLLFFIFLSYFSFQLNPQIGKK